MSVSPFLCKLVSFFCPKAKKTVFIKKYVLRQTDTIKQLPLEFSVDEVIDKIFLLENIEKGLQQSQKGKVTPDEDLDKKLPEWLV